jgi:hypothetical protein
VGAHQGEHATLRLEGGHTHKCFLMIRLLR